MNIVEKIDIYLLGEKKSPEEHATDRFWSFQVKAKDADALVRMLRLRTKKMNNVDKLKAWFKTLENENYHSEAAEALDKLRKLGYTGAV